LLPLGVAASIHPPSAEVFHFFTTDPSSVSISWTARSGAQATHRSDPSRLTARS
jgi:hypothetical protein